MLKKAVQGVILVCSLVAIVIAEAEEELMVPHQLAEKLKEGGYVLYFRHAATDHSKDDVHPVDFDDCKTQRNLSEEGREQSKMIGRQFKRLGIPVGEVVSSPYCRCKDTAKLAFGDYKINEGLHFAVVVGPEERRRMSSVLREELVRVPAEGANNIVVSHTANLREAAGIWPKPEGVAWVFQPDGEGGFTSLGKIDPAEWEKINI